MKTLRFVAVVAALTVVAACENNPSGEGLVARAGDQQLTVDDAVQILVDQENLPNQVQVVRALANLWTDYTLLATAVAKDSTLKALDLEPFIRQQLNAQVLGQYLDSVVQVDTVVTEDQLRTAYETNAPGVRIHARHILLSYPDQATQTQRDSVKAELEGLRRRILAGESFSDLARRYSQDQGSASNGGDLGTLNRDELVKPFADAALALNEGQVSDVVETPFGLHLIRLESKESPALDSVRDQFVQQIRAQRAAAADSAYVASLEERLHPEVQEGAVQVVKDLAASPGSSLSSRAAGRALVKYDGGELSVRDFQVFLQVQQPQSLSNIASAPDEQIDAFLKSMAQREMIVDEADAAGMAPKREVVDSLVRQNRLQIAQAAGDAGLRNLERAPGEALEPAIARAVRAALADILSGASGALPLGAITYQLRSRVPTQIYDAGVGQVVLRIGQVRASRQPAPADQPDSAADSTGTR